MVPKCHIIMVHPLLNHGVPWCSMGFHFTFRGRASIGLRGFAPSWGNGPFATLRCEADRIQPVEARFSATQAAMGRRSYSLAKKIHAIWCHDGHEWKKWPNISGYDIHSLRTGKIHRAIFIGNPSISMDYLYHGKLWMSYPEGTYKKWPYAGTC